MKSNQERQQLAAPPGGQTDVYPMELYSQADDIFISLKCTYILSKIFHWLDVIASIGIQHCTPLPNSSRCFYCKVEFVIKLSHSEGFYMLNPVTFKNRPRLLNIKLIQGLYYMFLLWKFHACTSIFNKLSHQQGVTTMTYIHDDENSRSAY